MMNKELNKTIDFYRFLATVRHHYNCWHSSRDGGSWSHNVCACYTVPETPGTTYEPASYLIRGTFERYIPVNTDSRLFKLANTESKVENGKTTYTEQSSSILNIYPEIAMLFQNDQGDESIKFVVGEQIRKVQPVSFHVLEHKVYVDEVTSVGTSIATDNRARVKGQSIGLGKAPVVHKGAGLNTIYEIKDKKDSPDRGYLEVRTYTLDVESSLKSIWGNSSYNTLTINDNFLSKFGSKKAGKWEFGAKLTDKLFISSSPHYTGAEVVNNNNYIEKTKSEKEYKLTIRGGVLTHVNNVPLATLKNNNPDLYEALVGMKLTEVSKELSALSTFEHQMGKALSEEPFKSLASNARNNIDNLEMGKGWYSEDSTTLIIKEYVTELLVPKTPFTNKIPMTVLGLETPVNKQLFYNNIAKGHNIVKYEVGTDLKAYFEHNTNSESPFGRAVTSYGVPNVSISDTTGLF